MAIQAQLYSDNLGFSLCGSQDWMDNGCGGFNQFCFNVQQKPQQLQQQQQQQQQQQHMQQLQNQQQRNQSLCFDNSLLVSTVKNNNNNNHLPMAYPQSLEAQAEKQRQEIDHYIRSQNERLRLLLQEQRKQQLSMLLKKIESKTSVFLRQKDEEIAKAANRAVELENFLKKLEMENRAWQRVAQENEAMVISLSNTLEQLREKASFCFDNGAEDEESCCDVNIEEEKTEENMAIGGGDVEERITRKTMMMVCKRCNSQNSCVLFLPCRHLCSCKACEAFLDSCPVCRTEKKASIEALIF